MGTSVHPFISVGLAHKVFFPSSIQLTDAFLAFYGPPSPQGSENDFDAPLSRKPPKTTKNHPCSRFSSSSPECSVLRRRFVALCWWEGITWVIGGESRNSVHCGSVWPHRGGE